MSHLKVILAALLSLLVWTVTVVSGVFLGWWRSPIAPEDDPAAFFDAAVAAIHENNRGNAALVLLEDGRIYRDHFVSRAGDPLDPDTMFPTASLSKWITAWGVMRLVEEGRLDLDVPVSRYLTRWQLPRGPHDNDDVTARRLLSHTAGLTDGLGFGDYQPHENVPPLEESLAWPRASRGRNVQISVGREPGSGFGYSGGGYLLLQLLVEEVSGQRFEDYMRISVLEPLGMARSTFEYAGDWSNVSPSYDAQGQRVPLYRYAASAATGYSTSAADLATFVLAQLPDRLPSRPLSQAGIDAMRQPHAFVYGAPIWGLGTMLYAPTPDGAFVFGHDGANEPAINAAARVNPDSGDGIAVLVSGHAGLASTLASEWVFWQTGKPDFLALGADFENVLPLLAVGGLSIVALVAAGAWWLRRRRRPNEASAV